MFYAHLLICTYIFASYLPVKPGLNGLEVASPLLPVFNCQIVYLMMVLPKVAFFVV